jgi:2-hydroxy-3-keto-5-methylthiopentenyl-1-phosphate phosphatase
MLPVRSVLVDFDGTACLHDVAEDLMNHFGDPDWREYDLAWERGEIDTRAGIGAQIAPFRGLHDELIAYALEHCPMDPTFADFARWCEGEHVPVTIVSDGLGLYVEPLLAAAGMRHIAVVTNDWAGGEMAYPNGHPECTWCGTCKMLAVQRAPRPVAFVGEGHSDRFGALYADVVFAKDALVGLCEADGVPYEPYTDFDDVRRTLERMTAAPGPVDPARCPGWRTA